MTNRIYEYVVFIIAAVSMFFGIVFSIVLECQQRKVCEELRLSITDHQYHSTKEKKNKPVHVDSHVIDNKDIVVVN